MNCPELPSLWPYRASGKRARSIRTILGVDAPSSSKGGAAFFRAHFPAATAVLAAPASILDGTGALVERAEPVATVFFAHPSCQRVDAAAFNSACHCFAVVFVALPSRSDGVGNALHPWCSIQRRPCLKRAHLPRTCGVSQPGSTQDSFTVCILHKRLFFCVQPSRRHLPFAPCLLHNPRTYSLAEQLSTEQSLPPCFRQSCPLRSPMLGHPSTEHTFFLPPSPLLCLIPQHLLIRARSRQEYNTTSTLPGACLVIPCCVEQLRLPPHFYPITNRVASHFKEKREVCVLSWQTEGWHGNLNHCAEGRCGCVCVRQEHNVRYSCTDYVT